MIGATSKWQSDGRNTLLAHGQPVDDSDCRSACAGASAAPSRRNSRKEGFFTVVTTRNEANAARLAAAIREQGGDCMIVELDLVSQDSIAAAFATIRREAGDPEVLVYNAGYLEGRDLPPDKELLEYVPVEMFDTGQHIAAPRAVPRRQGSVAGDAQEGPGVVFLLQQLQFAARARSGMTGQSLYYPRVMMRTLAQVLTEEYSEHGVHVANIVIDGTIDSPGTPGLAAQPEPPRPDHQSGQDRRGVLVPAHPGPLVLDARASADPVSDQAELLSGRRKGKDA